VSPLAQRTRLSALLGQRRGMVASLSVSSVIGGFAEAGMLVVLAQIAATLIDKSKHVSLKIAGLHIHTTVEALFMVALAFALVRLVLQAGPLSILPARIGADVQAKLRIDVIHAYTRASWEVQSRDREGHMQEIMTSQVLQATQGAQQATTLLTSGFTFLILMASAVELNARAAGLVLGAALLLFAAMRPLNRLGVHLARQLSRAQLDYAGGVSETVRLTEETNVFGVGAAQRDRIDRLIGEARILYLRTQTIMRLTPNLYQSLMYMLLIGGLAALYAVNKHDVASLGGVLLLLVRAGTNGQQIQGAYQGLRQSLPFIERLQDAAARYSESIPPAGERTLGSIDSLAFERVYFSYRPGVPVLSDIIFTVDGGEAIGVVGPSGAGKSTLVQILLQLRAPTQGRYLVNGLRADELAWEDWHRRVAYVPQEPRLVHASVADNIRYFRDIDHHAVERAARLARIHDDIAGWADGYGTIVGPRADAVSGGQQQRICLARALAARPDVLVLDEPTSALDPHSEALIQESLTGLKGQLTLFIIAHRMSTLDVCDRVMVIVNGRLAEFGTTELLRRESSYYRSAQALAAGGVLP
jgi:ABC-type multidrug transport system fused ATPase/permease subunit